MQGILNRIIPANVRRPAWLALAALVMFAVFMFRELLIPGLALFTTDDNIGVINAIKSRMPFLFVSNWDNSVWLGINAGSGSITWNGLLIWLAPIGFYFNWVHAVDLVGASVFLMLFLRSRAVSWPAVGLAVAAAFWLGSNLTLTYAGHLGKFGLLFMASIALVCIARTIAQKTSLLWAILAGGAIGFMFLEQLDVALFFGFVLGAYALFLAVRQWQANRTWIKSAGALALMGGMGLLLAVSTMLGSYGAHVEGAVSMQAESPREKWDFVTQWSWPPEESIDFIAPGYMGWRSGEPDGPYWGRMGRSAGWEQTRQGFMNFKLENQYLGIIPILLALFAIMAVVMGGKANAEYRMQNAELAECGEKLGGNPKSKPSADNVISQTPVAWHLSSDRRAEIVFWGCIVLITLLLAFGKYFPLYALFYKLPIVNSIRNPNKFLQVFQLALGILSAYGLDSIMGSALKTTDKT